MTLSKNVAEGLYDQIVDEEFEGFIERARTSAYSGPNQ